MTVVYHDFENDDRGTNWNWRATSLEIYRSDRYKVTYEKF